MSKEQEFAAAAIGMIGTKFRHQGRLPGIALDCAGLIVCAAKQVSYPVIDHTAYAPMPDPKDVLRCLTASFDRVEGVPNHRIGDVLLMIYNGRATHLAIIAEPDRIVHAWEAAGKVCAHDLDSGFSRRILATYRMRS